MHSDLIEPTFYPISRFELSFYRNQVRTAFMRSEEIRSLPSAASDHAFVCVRINARSYVIHSCQSWWRGFLSTDDRALLSFLLPPPSTCFRPRRRPTLINPRLNSELRSSASFLS